MAIPLKQIDEVRAFNRDYTRRIGVLSQRHLGSPYTLTQARVLYEIAHRPGVTAGTLARELGLDRGYLSRLLKGFAAAKLLAREVASADARRQHLKLTPAGRRAFAPLEQGARREIRTLLGGVDAGRRERLLQAMQIIRGTLQHERAAGITLRTHRPGDIGWVTERHGALYHQEFGWNEQFEALVAQIASEFIRRFDPVHERCWIAEAGGQRVGCVFLVAGENGAAKLRLLLVEPHARGRGLGERLIRECVAFARAAGYACIVLWTQASLGAARHLYARAGFVRVSCEPHTSFGHALIGETWQKNLHESGNATAPRRTNRGTKR